jgi:hypothetical protein
MLAWVRTHPSHCHREGISRLDGHEGFDHPTLLHLPDEKRHIHLGRTSLAAGRQAFVGLVQVEKPHRRSPEFKDVLRADGNALTASATPGCIDLRCTPDTEADGIEAADRNACAATDAAGCAAVEAPVKQGDGPAIASAVIMIKTVCTLAAQACGDGLFPLGICTAKAHDMRQGFDDILTAADTNSQWRLTLQDRLGSPFAADVTACTAIDAGQGRFDGRQPGVFFNIENPGGRRQCQGQNEAEGRHEQYGRSDHDLLSPSFPCEERFRIRSQVYRCKKLQIGCHLFAEPEKVGNALK